VKNRRLSTATRLSITPNLDTVKKTGKKIEAVEVKANGG
jgi:hypothetical protein